MSEPFHAVEETNPIPRDHYGRPLVTPPGGGKPQPYTRCTTFVSALEDTTALTKWKQRMTAIGLTERDDLLLAVAAHRDDKTQLSRICEEAMEAAKASAAATKGTALHALTEQWDLGKTPDKIPAEYRADIRAYRQATQPLTINRHWVEQFMVHDGYKIGGTPDRIITLGGVNYIADLKTGSIQYGIGKIAQQLAVYSRSVLYDHTTNTRTEVDVDQDKAIIIHLPAGSGKCELVWVDIAAGWEGVQLSAQVRQWRRRRGLTAPFADHITEAIRGAATEAELNRVYHDHVTEWADSHTGEAKTRKATIRGDAA